MSAENIASLAAAACSGAAALAALVAVLVLSRRVHDLREMLGHLDDEAVPLVRDARVVIGHAATEMERVGDVLASAEAVSETVDSASRLAYRVFANPVVKVLAFGTGTGTALRRLFSRRSANTSRTREGFPDHTSSAGFIPRHDEPGAGGHGVGTPATGGAGLPRAASAPGGAGGDESSARRRRRTVHSWRSRERSVR